MADNVAITPGSGATIATDDVAGVQYQRVKIGVGSDGSATDLAFGQGTMAASLPVAVASDQSTLPISAASLPLPTGAATAAKQPALGTAGTPSADVITVQGAAGMTAVKVDGSAVTQPVSIAATVAVNNSQVGGAAIAAGNGVSGTGVQRVTIASDSTGVVGLNAGSNLVGRVNPEPRTSGGLLISRVLSAASTNATSVKASAGQVYAIYAHNVNAAVRYLKLYDKASAPTVGTDTPVLTLPIPGNTQGAGFVLDTGGMGIAFANGIALAITTGVADADTGAVAANEIVVNLLYK